MITVALPVWKMEDIVWLQLESLCRQESAPPWELIIMECGANHALGEVKMRLDRLHKAGMTDFVYMHSETRIPLGLKWRDMARRGSHEAMVLCAGDNYSPPNRLEMAGHWIIGEGYDWFDVSSGLFYDINSGETAQWNRIHAKNSGLWMAVRRELLTGLGSDPPNIGIDAWIKSHLPEGFRWMQYPHALAGLHTDGKNTISHYRAGMYNGGTPGKYFSREGRQKLAECVPIEIFERLWKLQSASQSGDDTN